MTETASPIVGAEMISPVKFLANDPYHPVNPQLALVKITTVFDALDAPRRLSAGVVAYRFAWHEQPLIAGLIWMVGSIALIGGLWPAVLGFLVGAGFGPVQHYCGVQSLWRLEIETRLKMAQNRVHELLALIAQYEANLAASRELSTPFTEAARPDLVHPNLTSKPLEKAVPLPGASDRDFHGRFYPTEIHHEESEDDVIRAKPVDSFRERSDNSRPILDRVADCERQAAEEAKARIR